MEIAGPVGQHSNTPFRRNRSATLIKLANDKSVSPPPTSPASFSPTVTNSRKSLPVLQKLNQQQSSSNAMSVSSVSGLKYKEIGRSQDREEGDMDFGCVVESDQPSLAVLRRNSSTRSPSKKEAGGGGGVKKYDDEHDDSMEFKRASRRLSRCSHKLLIFLVFVTFLLRIQYRFFSSLPTVFLNFFYLS